MATAARAVAVDEVANMLHLLPEEQQRYFAAKIKDAFALKLAREIDTAAAKAVAELAPLPIDEIVAECRTMRNGQG